MEKQLGQSLDDYPKDINLKVKSRTSKGISKVFIIIIVALISAGIAGAGVWYWQQQELKKIEKSLKTGVTKPKTTPTTSPSASPDETADWKTYTNKDYGFSLKYPQEWTVEETTIIPPNGVGPSFSEGGVGVKWGVSVYNFDGRSISNDEYKTLPILENANYDFEALQTLNVDGISSKLYIVKNAEDIKVGYPIDVTVRKNDKVYNIVGWFNGSNLKDEFIPLFKKMLSTFKFTD